MRGISFVRVFVASGVMAVLWGAASCSGRTDDSVSGLEREASTPTPPTTTPPTGASDGALPTPTDGAAAGDATTPTEDAAADATSDASSDASVDAPADAAADADAGPLVCLDPSDLYCRLAGCAGGCKNPPDVPAKTCSTICNPVCPRDPVLAGACPPECNGGCADGTCHIDCDGNVPGICTYKVAIDRQGVLQPHVVCPKGLPCKVTCSNRECATATISCPREGACNIDCIGNGCVDTHFFCGQGPCTITGAFTYGSRRHPYLDWNYPGTVCGESCSCTLPHGFVKPWGLETHGAPGRVCHADPPPPPYANTDCKPWFCLCNDGQTKGTGNGGWCLNGICSTEAQACAQSCLAHGGWAAPDSPSIGPDRGP